MLCLKPFYDWKESSKSKSQFLYISDIRLGKIKENIFKRKSSQPYMFLWAINIGTHEPIFYGDSIEDCKEIAIEIFRDFINKVLQ